MNKDRINHMISILEGVSDDAFNILSYFSGDISKDTPQITFDGHTCGSSACALGYAAIDQSFNAQGFMLHRGMYSGKPVPMYREEYQPDTFNVVAAAHFFDLERDTINALFYPDDEAMAAEYADTFDDIEFEDGNISVKQVIAALRRLMEDGEDEFIATIYSIPWSAT